MGTHPGITYILRRLLALRGYDLLVADGIEEAIHAALGKRPKLVVVTPHFEGGDGMSFARTLRTLIPRTPLVILPEPFDVSRVLEALPDHRVVEARELA